jgi:hypothetical protein
MAEETAPTIIDTKAQDVLARYEAEKEIRGIVRPEMTPLHFLDALVSAERPRDAIRFWAHALPRRAAIWWSSLGITRFAPPQEPPDIACLDATNAWVSTPGNDTIRREAMVLAEAAGFGSPAACAATAVFFSGGTIAPPDLSAVEPATHLCGDSVANALCLAAVTANPEKAAETFARLIQLGKDVELGKPPWPKA